jgi:hypothetical protein
MDLINADQCSDDSLSPGFRLKVPMMIMLDTLKSEDPHLRRIGETWMRCSLKSYIRYMHHMSLSNKYY